MVVTHEFRGPSSTRELPILEGQLRIPIRERTESGVPIEWYEVSVGVAKP